MTDVVILNKPFTGQIPPTPTEMYGDESTLATAGNFAVFKVARRYGFPIAYAQEQNGKVWQDIFPIRRTERNQISTSSKVDLGLHTETAFHPYKPDHVFLFCLRGDENAVTTYATLSDIVTHLSDDDVSDLKQPDFITTIDESFRTHGEKDKEIVIRPLSIQDGELVLTYDKLLMRGLTDKAQSALDKLDEAIQKSIQEVVLKQYDLMVINNRTVVHGRKAFTPRYDGNDRWLRRIMTRKVMPPESERKLNVITTTF